MVCRFSSLEANAKALSVLALSSRFDGPVAEIEAELLKMPLSVLALSSRFDGLMIQSCQVIYIRQSFSTRSVESF